MGQVGRCVKCRAASVQFPPQVKEKSSGGPRGRSPFTKVSGGRLSGPFCRCDSLLGKKKTHVKTASYNINMYKYITNTRSYRRNRGRKHENNKKTKRKTMKMEKNLPDCPFGTSWRLNCQVLEVKLRDLSGDSAAAIVRTATLTSDFTVQWQFVSVKTNAWFCFCFFKKK